jgi:hypothetical protein
MLNTRLVSETLTVAELVKFFASNGARIIPLIIEILLAV